MSIGSGLVRLDPSLLNRALGNMEELIKQSAAPAKKVAAEAPQR
jgi:hypothetical protein